MKNKYDTNELDTDFPERARQTQKAEEMPTKQFTARPFAEKPFAAESQTQRFDNFDVESPYQSVYTPQVQQTQKLSVRDIAEKPTSRKVAGLNLPENLMMIAPYCPFSIGLVAAIIELLFTPRSETRVRFHAAQGLAMQLGILVVGVVLGTLGNLSDWADNGNSLFYVFATVYLIYAMHRIWRGYAFNFETIDDATDWLGEKIKPVK